MKSLRVLVMCCRGEAQDYLIRRTAEEFTLCGVLRHAPDNPKGTLGARMGKYLHPGRLAEYLAARIVLPAEDRRAAELAKSLFGESRGNVSAQEHAVQDVNSPDAIEFVSQCAPDIVLVNGTNLVRREMLALKSRIRHGFINLHTGLSPYSRGGNCNLFMLLESRPELVGITIHYIDLGIDRGDIIQSAQTPMDAADNYEMIELRGFHRGIETLLESARRVAAGKANRVRQWEKGKLFLQRTGYVYRPYHRVVVNRMLRNGLVREYLADKARRSAGVRLVGPQCDEKC